MKRQLKIWLECFRLRTLPVSLSGVIIAIGVAKWQQEFRWVPALLCVVFALLAQIVSNTANEYFDYLQGSDKPGRVGPRRGVTEGDIKPTTLRNVTFGLLVLAGAVGCCLIPYGGWWLLPAGIVIALAALAYSTGPYPLSYHGLGELMVFIFFGIVPVNLTYYVMSLRFDPLVILFSITIGLLGVNVLLVNNYRDMEDDLEAGKRTSVVIFGRKAAALAYLINGYAGMGMLSALWVMIAARWGMGGTLPVWTLVIPVIYLVMHTATWYKLTRRQGTALNPLLGETARNMLIFTLLLTIVFIIYS
jgi:1,4-dihydroxy-2-naphthoate octaprenyltransferase